MSAEIIDFDSWREGKKILCPKCHSADIARIFYGIPGSVSLATRDPDVVMGGCVVDEDSPRSCCKQCGNRF